MAVGLVDISRIDTVGKASEDFISRVAPRGHFGSVRSLRKSVLCQTYNASSIPSESLPHVGPKWELTPQPFDTVL